MRRAIWQARARQASCASTERWDGARDIVVVNKIDLRAGRRCRIAVPCRRMSGDGLPELLGRIEQVGRAR